MKREYVGDAERYQSFLDRLRQARCDLGMTQNDVAAALGRPQSFVSRCETGEYRLDLIELEVFARLYEKDVTFFVPASEDDSEGVSKSRVHRVELADGDRLLIIAEGSFSVQVEVSQQIKT